MDNMKLAVGISGLVVATAAGACAIVVGAHAVYERLPTFQALRANVTSSQPVQFVGRQIRAAQTNMANVARHVGTALQDLMTPTLGKVAALYGLGASAVAVGFFAIAVTAASPYIAIPAVLAAFISVAVTYSIRNLYLIASGENNSLDLFNRHIATTIGGNLAFFSTLTALGVSALGIVFLARESRGTIVIHNSRS